MQTMTRDQSLPGREPDYTTSWKCGCERGGWNLYSDGVAIGPLPGIKFNATGHQEWHWLRVCEKHTGKDCGFTGLNPLELQSFYPWLEFKFAVKWSEGQDYDRARENVRYEDFYRIEANERGEEVVVTIYGGFADLKVTEGSYNSNKSGDTFTHRLVFGRIVDNDRDGVLVKYDLDRCTVIKEVRGGDLVYTFIRKELVN